MIENQSAQSLISIVNGQSSIRQPANRSRQSTIDYEFIRHVVIERRQGWNRVWNGARDHDFMECAQVDSVGHRARISVVDLRDLLCAQTLITALRCPGASA